MSRHGHTQSYYAASANQIDDFPQFSDSVEADVCIIGGGFTGLSAALHLAEAGYACVLLEAEKLGWGASGRNGGQVSIGQNQDQYWLEEKLGKQAARQLWDIGLESVDLVKQLIQTHQIQCDWTPGILETAWKKSDVKDFQEEVEKIQTDYQFSDIRFVSKQELHGMLGTHQYHGGSLDKYSGHIHPLNFALGLANAAKNAGAKMFEYSRVTDIQDGKTVTVKTDKGLVKAKNLLVACNGYLGKLVPKVAGKIMPLNNFIVATEPLSEQLARELIRDNVAVADSKYVLNYYRLSADKRLLFGGGETYSSKFPSDIKKFVRRHMLEIYPQLKEVKIDYGWGGTLALTLNRMPHFERIADNQYVAQGYSGHGVALATLGGKLIAKAIQGSVEKFDVMANVPTPTFPGGTLLRYPGQVAGMLFYSLLDRLP